MYHSLLSFGICCLNPDSAIDIGFVMQYVLIDDQTRVHVESDSVIGKPGHIVR